MKASVESKALDTKEQHFYWRPIEPYKMFVLKKKNNKLISIALLETRVKPQFLQTCLQYSKGFHRIRPQLGIIMSINTIYTHLYQSHRLPNIVFPNSASYLVNPIHLPTDKCIFPSHRKFTCFN